MRVKLLALLASGALASFIGAASADELGDQQATAGICSAYLDQAAASVQPSVPAEPNSVRSRGTN